MREYAKIAPQFWTGDTGRALRQRGSAHQLLAVYLITSPSSNMLGLYYLPLGYIAHDVGIPITKVTAILQELQRLGFCHYDMVAECVFVVEMARFQICEQLQPTDKRIPWLIAEYSKCPSDKLRHAFLARYRDAFHLTEAPGGGASKRPKIPSGLRWTVLERDNHTCQYCGRRSPQVPIEVDHQIPLKEGGKTIEENLVAACWECNNGKNAKPLGEGLPMAQDLPLRSQEQEQEQDQDQEKEQEQDQEGSRPKAKVLKMATEYPEGWTFNERHKAIAEGFQLCVEAEAVKFRDHHQARGSKFKDWDAAFRTWLSNAVEFRDRKGGAR